MGAIGDIFGSLGVSILNSVSFHLFEYFEKEKSFSLVDKIWHHKTKNEL